MSAKTLAYAPLILADEPLDGWLEHIAATLLTTVVGVTEHCGLAAPTMSPFYFVRGLSDEELGALADVAGQSVVSLRTSTLERWQEYGLCPTNGPGATSQRAWTKGSGANYCPDCFAERDGRWKLAWYLQWSFACASHQRVLHNRCVCGTTPRSSATWRREFSSRRADECSTCAATLTWHGTAPDLLFPDHPVVRAQSRIDELLGHPSAPAVIAGMPTDHRSWFTDLSVLTRAVIRLAQELPADAAARAVAHEEDQSALAEQFDRQTRPKGEASPGASPQPAIKRLALGAAQPAFFAACAAAAVDILDSDHPDELRARIDAFPRRYTNGVHQLARKFGASSALTSALGGRSHTKRVLEAVGRETMALNKSVADLVVPSQVPARVFESIRFEHPEHLKGELASAAASAVILGWSHMDLMPNCPDLLGIGHLTKEALEEWVRLCELDANRALVRDLIAVRGLLVESGNPIDFARRRHTFPTPRILADRVVRPVARELDVPLTRAFALSTSMYVYEQLSGSDALLSDPGIRLPGAFRMRFRRLRTRWNQRPVASVDAITEAALLRHRMNEPVRWEPIKTDDTWVHPEPDYTRTLPGWATRELRRSSRYRTPGQLRHATLDQIIEFAHTDTSGYATEVRGWLEDVGRLIPDVRVPSVRHQIAINALVDLASHTQRQLISPRLPVGWQRPRLTPQGVELVQAIHAYAESSPQPPSSHRHPSNPGAAADPGTSVALERQPPSDG